MKDKTSFDAAYALIGICYAIETFAEMRGIYRRRLAEASEVRKFFIGKTGVRMDRDAWKRAAKRQCRILGWGASDDNAAEALGLWAYACALEAPSAAIQTGPLFTGLGPVEEEAEALSRGAGSRRISADLDDSIEDIPV